MPRSGEPRRPLLGAIMLGFAAWQAAFINTPPSGSSRGRPWLPSAPKPAKTVAAAGTGSESFLWVQVEGGGPVEYSSQRLRNVGGLLEQVYAKVERRLPAGVGVDQLKLYISKEAFENGEEAALQKLTVLKLKAICRKRRLKVSGRKAELIQRILDDATPTQEVQLPMTPTLFFLNSFSSLSSTTASPAVRIVTAKDFDIRECKRPPAVDVNRPGLVKLDECVQKCVANVDEWLPQQTHPDHPRVPPVMLSRCMRGGKTTVLCKVFDELKASGKNPIFISFNGDTIIRRLAHEKPLETMLRAIAAALMREKPGSTDEADTVRCDKLVLKDFLKDRDNVVLLVDELNVLLKPSDTDDYEDVGLFLRQTLLFSTHVPTSAGIDKLLGKGSGSPRDAKAVEMPKSYNVTELRGMHEKCEALTPCEAAYYSYIPSLIYTVKTQPSYDFKARFRDTSKPTASAELIASFLAEFFSGERLDDGGHIRAFDSLTESPGRGQVRWVLGYAGRMCKYLGEVDIARWIDQLPDLAEKVESGQDWEEIVRIALALRCIQAKFAQPHALLMLEEGAPRPAAVFLKTVPTEHCKRPEDMLAWWKTHSVRTYPYIAVLSPNYAKTEVIDVMWVYQESEESEYVVRGIQDKLSKELPHEDMPEGMHGLLFRGQAPDKETEPQKRRRWTYPGSADICEFLGASLEPIYPARWPVSAC